ncbi:MAG: ribose-phosphate pyrophosphokinase [Cyanobacteria bacterium J06642_2]
MKDIVLFYGSANPSLAVAIARHLEVPMGALFAHRFPDGEVSVRLLESVRGKEVFVVQSTSPPADEHLMELIMLLDACRREAPASITAIVPYFGYSRSDKRRGGREPIGARVVADMLQNVGVDRLITMDLHAPQVEGFFRIPVQTLTAARQFYDVLGTQLDPDVIVVAPDPGRVEMAARFAQELDTSVAVLYKHRDCGSRTHLTRVIGDVANRPCLIVDDMISTGETVERAIVALREAGARAPYTVAATHGLLLEGSQNKLSGVDALYVTDSISLKTPHWPQLHVVSIARDIAETISQLVGEEESATIPSLKDFVPVP